MRLNLQIGHGSILLLLLVLILLEILLKVIIILSVFWMLLKHKKRFQRWRLYY